MKLFAIAVVTLPFFSHAATPKKFCSKYKCEKPKGDVKIGHFAGNVINDRFLNDTTQKQFNAESEFLPVGRPREKEGGECCAPFLLKNY